MKTVCASLRLCLFALVLAGWPAIAHAQVTAKPILHATVDTTKGSFISAVWLDHLDTGQTEFPDQRGYSNLIQRFQAGVWQITASAGLTIVNGNDNVARVSNFASTSDNKTFSAHYKDAAQQLDCVIDVTGDTQATGHLFLTLDNPSNAQSVTYVIEVPLKVDSTSAPAPGTGGTVGG